MRRLGPRHLFAAGFVLAVVGLATLFVGVPQPVIAQFSAQGTWIHASGVSGSNAVVLTVQNITAMADLLGVPLRFFPNTANVAGGTTIQVNSYSAYSVLRSSGGSLVPIAGGDFSPSVAAEVVWDGTQFEDENPATGNDAVGQEKTFTNTVSAGWLTEDGTCKSETTYAALYAYYGSTDLWLTQAGGIACPSGEFHVPLANGRIAVAVNNQGSGTGPLTNCTAGVTNNCGAPTQALSSTNQLPLFTPSGTNAPSAVTLSSGVMSYVSPSANYTSGGNEGPQSWTEVTGGTAAAQVFTGNSIGSASPSSFSVVNPNYQVFKAVKY